MDNLYDRSLPTDIKQTNPQEARKQSIQRCIQSLVHACQKMKRVVQHGGVSEDARWLSNLQAADCAVLLPREALPGGQVTDAVLSAQQAEAAAAPAEVCGSILFELHSSTNTEHLSPNRLQQLLRRRMAVMNTTRMGTAPTLAIAASSGPSPLPPVGPSGGSPTTSVPSAVVWAWVRMVAWLEPSAVE